MRSFKSQNLLQKLINEHTKWVNFLKSLRNPDVNTNKEELETMMEKVFNHRWKTFKPEEEDIFERYREFRKQFHSWNARTNQWNEKTINLYEDDDNVIEKTNRPGAFQPKYKPGEGVEKALQSILNPQQEEISADKNSVVDNAPNRKKRNEKKPKRLQTPEEILSLGFRSLSIQLTRFKNSPALALMANLLSESSSLFPLTENGVNEWVKKTRDKGFIGKVIQDAQNWEAVQTRLQELQSKQVSVKKKAKESTQKNQQENFEPVLKKRQHRDDDAKSWTTGGGMQSPDWLTCSLV